MKDEIWVFAECTKGCIRKDSLEAIGEAESLGKSLKMSTVAFLIGSDVGFAQDAIIAQGIDTLRVLDSQEWENFDVARYAEAIAKSGDQDPPAVMIVAQSPNGLALGPRLAACWKCTFIPNMVSFTPAEKAGYKVVQSAYENKAYIKYFLKVNKQVVLGTQPGSVGVGSDVKKPVGKVENNKVRELPQPQVSVIGFKKANPREVALDEADKIVAGGLGYASKDDLSILWDLSDALGAALGGSKPVFDNGWIPRSRFIGQSSGRKVAPRLFIAVGISGTNYFMGGMKGSQNVIAINKDKGAPIMKAADLAVVGELHELVPALTEALEDRKKKEVKG